MRRIRLRRVGPVFGTRGPPASPPDVHNTTNVEPARVGPFTDSSNHHSGNADKPVRYGTVVPGQSVLVASSLESANDFPVSSYFHWYFNDRSGLTSFRQMLCALQPLPCKSTSSRIFPCALPFRCVARDVTLSCKVRWARRFVNDMFAWFSWLEVGCPADPQRVDMMRWIPSEVCCLARQYADRLVDNLLRQRLSHRSICIADLTTGRGRLDTLVTSLGPIGYHPSAVPSL